VRVLAKYGAKEANVAALLMGVGIAAHVLLAVTLVSRDKGWLTDATATAVFWAWGLGSPVILSKLPLVRSLLAGHGGGGSKRGAGKKAHE